MVALAFLQLYVFSSHNDLALLYRAFTLYTVQELCSRGEMFSDDVDKLITRSTELFVVRDVSC
jgi:hypothetical protein